VAETLTMKRQRCVSGCGVTSFERSCWCCGGAMVDDGPDGHADDTEQAESRRQRLAERFASS
jgi:hypothetical protein